MSFLYPLGLLGLIGIPILIAVYIIKSKYTEQTVASTYLWTLSEKFLKRKNPISKLTGIIALILQLLAVVLISLAIAHPMLTVSGGAESYVFVLDGSGSMSYENSEGKTRLEEGKKAISDMIKSAVDGSRFTLVYAEDTSDIVFKNLRSKEQAEELLSKIGISHSGADLDAAVAEAAKIYAESAKVKTYIITDKTYPIGKNTEIIKVGETSENYAVVSADFTYQNGALRVFGEVISYESDKTLDIKLFINGRENAEATLTVEAVSGERAAYEFSLNADAFEKAEVRIEGGDSQPLDDVRVIYNEKFENSYATLLISDRPFFLETVLAAASNASVETVTPEEFGNGRSGYGLYIFDGYSPEELPKDGAVWLINVGESVENSGFSVQGEVAVEGGGAMELTASSASVTKKLINGVKGKNLYLTDYIKCGIYRNYTTLFSYKGAPLIFTGTNTYGNRQAVFAFDLHKSNLPLTADFTVLAKNLLDYSFPAAVEETSYNCGDTASINVISNCENIRVDSPLGNTSYLTLGGEAAEFLLSEVGSYKITMSVAGAPRTFNIYSAFPEGESDPNQSADSAISIEAKAGTSALDAVYDNLIWVIVAIALIFTADWVVYCYEKYQLR